MVGCSRRRHRDSVCDRSILNPVEMAKGQQDWPFCHFHLQWREHFDEPIFANLTI